MDESSYNVKRLYRLWRRNPSVRAAFEARTGAGERARDRHAQPLGYGGTGIGRSVDVDKWLRYVKADSRLDINDDICDRLQRWELGEEDAPAGWEAEADPPEE